MALIHCSFFSQSLMLSMSAYVVLPQPAAALTWESGGLPERKHPVLYLLHGLSDDHTIWQRRTSIERYIDPYVDPLGLAVVMPDVHRSWYTDMAHGSRYWTYISEELPALMRSFFPISEARDDNFVAGLSMGGYGAFKLALSHPERYAAAASLSGALDISQVVTGDDPAWQAEMQTVFGDPARCAAAPVTSSAWPRGWPQGAHHGLACSSAAAPKISFTRTTCVSAISPVTWAST